MRHARSSLALCLGLLWMATAGAVTPQRARPSVPMEPLSTEAVAALARKLAVEPLRWSPDWDAAQRLAARENLPMLAYFHSPVCNWCHRMDEETLAAPEVRRRLGGFVLVKVNILEDERTSARFRVRGTPTLVFLSPEGRESFRLDGFLQEAALLPALDGVLANRLQSADQRLQSLLAQLRAGKLRDEDWAEIVVALGNDRHRQEIERTILALRPLPRSALVGLLQHPLLTVRLGALELLEEMAGDDFDFNPWRDSPADNDEALAKWRDWTAATGPDGAEPPAFYRILSATEIGDCLQDLIGEDPDRAARARRLLAKDPASCLEGIATFAAAHPGLPAGSARKLRELRFALLLPAVKGLESSSVAHRLVYGNLDVRLNALRDVATARQSAVPVIAEFLGDSEPLVRETAVDALVISGGREAVGLLEALLRKETDANVIYVVLRQLGNLRSKKGLGLLLQYLGHANEDFVIVALESIAKLRVGALAEAQVGACLADTRWRVRTAALKAAEDLTLQALAPQVVSLLDDRDEFVRGSAVATLAKLGVGDSIQKLEAIFAEDDALKGPIVKALLAANQTIPASMLRVLEDRPPSVKLAVLDNIERLDAEVAPLVVSFAAAADADLACASLRLLAATGLELAPARAAVAQQMLSGDRRRLLAIMEAVALEKKTVARYNPAMRKVDFEAVPLEGKDSAEGDPLAELFAAFEESPVSAGNAGVTVDEIFAAFGEETGMGESFVDTLRRVGRRTLEDTGDGELRLAAARMLLQLGDGAGVPTCVEALPRLEAGRRQGLAELLERVRNRDGLPLIRSLLADPSAEVRGAASRSLMADGATEACLRLLLSELEAADARLQVPEVFSVLRSALTSRSGRAVFADAARRWLQAPPREPLRLLALLLSAKVWGPESERLVEPFLAAENPWQRRAAFYALGRNNRPRFLAEVPRVAADSAEIVRELVPHLCLPPEADSGRFIHYFDERTQESEWTGSSGARGMVAPLPDGALQALRTLVKDPSERVGFMALVALIARQQPVDLGEVVKFLERMPRDSELLDSFSDYVMQHYAKLGREFAVVLPYLDWDRGYGGEVRAVQIRQHFGVAAEEDVAAPAVVRTGRAPGRVIGSYAAPVATPAATAEIPPENYRVVYFTKPGCKECAAVARRLEQLREAFPEATIVEYDINKTASLLLNEALGERFGVPVGVRLVAPAVYCGGGYLIKDDITLERLGPMLARAATVPLADWLTVPAADLAGAHQVVTERFQTTGLWLVLLAGLLDGVNPCAFATIIFLLSYLQVSRRSPRAMLQIGAAYVAGVFLAYFTVGLGLVKVAAMVTRLQWAGPLLNYAMAGFALFIMALNIRDGVRCRRDQLAEMTLQLPDVLKNRIHWLIRHGVRQAHFVLVSFFLGVAISVLELACTGQVYLPTITYMIQQGEARAVWSLLAYNLAFITPLAVVFALTHKGLRSEMLVKLLKRRAAWVKFGTAFCFLLLALFLLFGAQLFG